MTTPQILEEAANLVEKGWTREVYATDKHGEPVDLLSTEASCFCGMGALAKVVGKESPLWLDREVKTKVCEALGISEVTDFFDWNDSHSQAEVAERFRLAASKARQEEEL